MISSQFVSDMTHFGLMIDDLEVIVERLLCLSVIMIGGLGDLC